MLKNGDLAHNSAAYWCVVSGSALWLEDGNLPFGTASDFGFLGRDMVCVGHYQDVPVMWLNDMQIEERLPMGSLRECIHYPEALFLLISKAVQYGHMTQSMRFCPLCGGRNHLNHNQLAMQCTECHTLHYPRIFPCIIVAVRKEQQLLLAQHPRHPNGMYTVIAGFLEVGETLEQCVAREVKEETGINITNIRYFGSQPWAFPSSMMMAFLADYHSGNIKPDYSELSDAQWFLPDEMPLVAPKGTIARQLIDKTIADIKGHLAEN